MSQRGRPPADLDTKAIRVESGVAEKLRIIASIRRTTIAKLLDPLIRPLVEREYGKALKEASSSNGDGA